MSAAGLTMQRPGWISNSQAALISQVASVGIEAIALEIDLQVLRRPEEAGTAQKSHSPI